MTNTDNKEGRIPKNLHECIEQLLQSLTPRAIAEFKSTKEEKIIRYHHGFGTGLRNSWGLWSGSRLKKYFNSLGIYHADDMSGIIIKSFWRHLNNQPIRLKEQIKRYQKCWEEEGIDIKAELSKNRSKQGNDLS